MENKAYKITCTYCGTTWEVIDKKQLMQASKCHYCGDKNLTIRDITLSKINYYAGSPSFPEESDSKEPEDDPFKHYRNSMSMDDMYFPGTD